MSVRSIIAVLGGIVIVWFLAQALEIPIVNRLAAERPTTVNEYLAARYQTPVVAGRMFVGLVAGLLAGYIVAKVAERHPLRHAMVAAALQGAVMTRDFAHDDFAAAAPLWGRPALVLITCGAMLAGASVRARAAGLRSSAEGGS